MTSHNKPLIRISPSTKAYIAKYAKDHELTLDVAAEDLIRRAKNRFDTVHKHAKKRASVKAASKPATMIMSMAPADERNPPSPVLAELEAA